MKMKQYFLDGKSEEQKKLFYKVIDLGFDFINGKTRNNKVLQYEKPEFFKNKLTDTLPEKGMSDEKIFQTIEEVGKYSISQSDLNYLAFPDAGNSIAALLGDIYSKFLNQNMIAFDRSAPYATFIEIQLIEWLREYIGYDFKKPSEINSLSEVSGMWTTGGHMSNHIAIMTALNHKFGDVKVKGLNALGISPKIVLAGKITHYSVTAAIHHLGIGTENIINTASNADFTTDTKDLERILEEHKESNDIFMVVGVAGNTRTSSIDNLREIAKICQKYGVWFHIDACHGGSLILSDKIKKRDLDGIEEADSISLDPHKGMFVAYPCSFVMFKKRDALVKFTRYEEQVRNGEAWDLAYITPFFGSRGFDSIKLWLLIKSLGKSGLAEVVEKRDDDSQFVFKMLKNSKLFTLFHDMTFYRLCFVFLPDEIKTLIEAYKSKLDKESLAKLKNCIDSYTHNLNQGLYEEGNVCLDEFKLHDIGNTTNLDAGEDRFYVMSVTVGNPLYTEESLSSSLKILFDRAQSLLPQFKKDVELILNLESSYQEKVVVSYGPAGWN